MWIVERFHFYVVLLVDRWGCADVILLVANDLDLVLLPYPRIHKRCDALKHWLLPSSAQINLRLQSYDTRHTKISYFEQ